MFDNTESNEENKTAIYLQRYHDGCVEKMTKRAEHLSYHMKFGEERGYIRRIYTNVNGRRDDVLQSDFDNDVNLRRFLPAIFKKSHKTIPIKKVFQTTIVFT